MYFKLNSKKEMIIKSIVNRFSLIKSLTIFDYSKLNVEKISLLREILFKNNCELKIFKNKLIKIALEKCKYDNLLERVIGHNAFIFEYSADFSAFRELYNFQKDNESVKIKFGILNKKLIEEKEIIKIAKIPAYNDLMAIFAFDLLFPIQKFLFTIKALISKKEK